MTYYITIKHQIDARSPDHDRKIKIAVMAISQIQSQHKDQPHSPSLPSLCLDPTSLSHADDATATKVSKVCEDSAAPSVKKPHPRPHPADEGFL
jgi:hypothetical protein